MNSEIHTLDVVALTDDIPEHGLRRGQVGTVIESLRSGMFEIEFVDNDGRTYATLPLKSQQLLVLYYQPV
jgi:biotin operon repressor